MAIIFKDFHTFKRINSIPRESIEEIKAYLNEIGVIFSEGVVPMNWNAVLQQIREDFEAFLETGGWRFLQEDEHEEVEGEDSELAGDPEFSGAESDDDSDASDVESDISDEDDDEYSSEADGDESEGLSWDELEKRAYEDDRTAAQRRHQQNDDKDRGRRVHGQRRR